MPIITIIWMCFIFFKTATPAAVLENNNLTDDYTTYASMSLKDVEKEIQTLMKSLTRIALPFFVRNSSPNVSSPCISTFIKMFMDLRNLKLPVLKMLDAIAKPPSGILKGSVSFMGDYDECLEIKVNKKGEAARTEDEEIYHGQYCMVEAELPTAFADGYINYRNKKVNVSIFGKLAEFIDELPMVNLGEGALSFKAGICMPSTCSTLDLQELLALIPINAFKIRVKYCDDGKMLQLSVGQIMFIAFIVLLGTLVTIGTILEMCFYLKDHKNKAVQVLLAFSLYGNTKKLMKVEKNSTGSQIPVISGMYVIGSLFVIIYHTYFMPFFMNFSSHGAYLGKSMSDWKFTIMSTMGISIDCYFLFSGIFMVYPRYRREGKEVKINVFKIIVRRYLKFCPSMMVILGVIVSLPLIGSGPVWSEIFDVAAKNARKWWWTYFLMFNNFLPVENQSFFPLWFIPCLMQITIIGTVLLWFMSKDPKFGIFLIVVTCLSCNIALGVLTYLRNYPLTYAMYYYHKRDDIERVIYTSPLSHVAPYGIGMLLGYYMAKNPTQKWSRIHVIAGWIFAFFSVIGTQLFCYIGHEGQDLDPTITVLYAATHRISYSLGLSWIILACTYGHGGVFNEFFSWKGFGVLAKLSYSGYLLHYIVITYHVSFTREPLAFSHYETFIRFCGYTVVSIIASYLLYTTFELPMSYIESLLFTKRAGSNAHDTVSNQANGKCTDANFLKEDVIFNSDMLKPPMVNEQKLPNDEEVKIGSVNLSDVKQE